ncbi:protein 60A-like [Anopheles ziemanni]|uniref:protein 60A-like n=1 Tax=Anopheles ziemanni TaxID=345580 RepID=UPI0026581FB8|nr:protein 60A-like isoform X1 [Anopheles coustani]XP_058170383.1 protein 60A-like [Anopheles ziemanni]
MDQKGFFLACFLCCILQSSCSSLSGIYVDNGVGQTVLEDALSVEEQQEIENEILHLLGLPGPRPVVRHLHSSVGKSAPQFLLNVYDQLQQEENEVAMNSASRIRKVRSTGMDILITDADRKAIDESDIIMTFLNKNHHGSEMRHEKGRRLWFGITNIENDVSVLMAELRLYRKQMLNKYSTSNTTVTLTVYAIIDVDGESEMTEISSMELMGDYEGWLEINVTGAAELWLKNKQANHGFYVGAYIAGHNEREVKLDDIGFVSVRGSEEYQPFLVVYANSPQQMVQPTLHRQPTRNKRSSQQRRRKTKTEHRNPLYHPTFDQHKSCRIQQLYVSFKDLQWHEWIIAPEGYGAYYCSGECNFPLNAHMNATNHAIVQTLVHLNHPTKVPKPCCAPTKLIPISVLYHIDESNVNLKKYKNMVVKSCGCH